MALITCENVYKYFQRVSGHKLLREHLADMRKPSEEDDRFYALRDVSFTVEPGQGVGILGRNGSGKSTLLNLISGAGIPDSGTIKVNGRMAALLELGSGFHPDLTGRENLSLNAALIGLTRAETERFRDAIIEFSELKDFIDEPLRTYSSGMVVRLAFSVSIQVQCEVLVVDEILAVGDQAFQAKCLDLIRSRQRSGMTLLMVSHAPALIQQFCSKALWLDQGRAATVRTGRGSRCGIRTIYAYGSERTCGGQSCGRPKSRQVVYEGCHSSWRLRHPHLRRDTDTAQTNDRDWRAAYSLAHHENLLPLWVE